MEQSNKSQENAAHGEFIIYQTDNSDTRIDVRFEDETVWLTQAQLTDLFQSSKANISEHIKHLFEEGELKESSVIRKFRTTVSDGKSYFVNHYNYYFSTKIDKDHLNSFI